MSSNVLLYSTEKYIHYPAINHNGKEYIGICMAESLCCTVEINTIVIVCQPPDLLPDTDLLLETLFIAPCWCGGQGGACPRYRGPAERFPTPDAWCLTRFPPVLLLSPCYPGLHLPREPPRALLFTWSHLRL